MAILHSLASEQAISVVIPCLNEAESLPLLLKKVNTVVSNLTGDSSNYEIIIVDDGSTDESPTVIQELKKLYPTLRSITFRRNFGKAAALNAAFRHVRGKFVITLDADLQDDPTEIPRMIEALEQGYDVVSGWKAQRKDPLSKTIPSKIFNKTLALLSGIPLHDYNCGFKAYRREAIDELYLYGELHRYIPVLLHYRGFKITEIPVQHHPRQFGHSKYGIERFTRGFFDLLTVILITRYATRPLHAFGGVGLILGTSGFGILAYLTLMKIAYGIALSDRPLLFLGILLLLMGLQLISTGLVGEMITRFSYRSQRPYAIIDDAITNTSNQSLLGEHPHVDMALSQTYGAPTGDTISEILTTQPPAK